MTPEPKYSISYPSPFSKGAPSKQKQLGDLEDWEFIEKNYHSEYLIKQIIYQFIKYKIFLIAHLAPSLLLVPTHSEVPHAGLVVDPPAGLLGGRCRDWLHRAWVVWIVIVYVVNSIIRCYLLCHKESHHHEDTYPWCWQCPQEEIPPSWCSWREG